MVDDDADLRGVVRLFLERRGFAVDEADGSASALEVMGEFAPNLVVVDDLLDGIATGLELALIVAARRPWTRVLALSIHLDSRARFTGVDAVLNKADIAQIGDLADRLVPPDIAEHS